MVLYSGSLLAEGVVHFLGKEPGLEVLQAVATEQNAAAQVRELKPDVVIMDSQDGGLNPDEVVPSLLVESPGSHVLCLTIGQTCPGVCVDRCTPISTKGELMRLLHMRAGVTRSASPD